MTTARPVKPLVTTPATQMVTTSARRAATQPTYFVGPASKAKTAVMLRLPPTQVFVEVPPLQRPRPRRAFRAVTPEEGEYTIHQSVT